MSVEVIGPSGADRVTASPVPITGPTTVEPALAVRFGITARLTLLGVGAALVASSVAAMIRIGLGAGPLDASIIAIASASGIPVSAAVWLTVGTLTLVARLLGGRPGFGTIAAPVVIGPVFQIVLELLEAHPVPQHAAVRMALHVATVGGVGLGAAMIVASDLGAGMQELLAFATAARLHRSPVRVRAAHETIWVSVALALGGPVGVGTLLFAALIGPAVDVSLRCIGRTSWAAIVPTGTRPRDPASTAAEPPWETTEGDSTPPSHRPAARNERNTS